MKILVAASKVDFGPRQDEVVAAIRRLAPAVRVVSAGDLDWQMLIRTEGSFDGAYAWAVRVHDALCVVETSSRTIGRGVFSMAEGFLVAGKRVVVLRDGTLKKVVEVRLTGEDDWKSRYGSVVIDG